MSTKILYWTPTTPLPIELILPDAVASAFVRAGVAAAADPAQEGALLVGGPLDGGTPTDIVLEHGVPGLTRMIRLSVPQAVAQVAVAAGAAAPIISGTISAVGTAPGAPTLSLAAGDGQVTLSWTDGSDGGSPITAHKLYRGIAGGAEALVGTILSGSPYIDAGRANGTPLFYKVSAVNGVGEGALSNEVSATPAAAALVVPTRYLGTVDDFEAAGPIAGRAHWTDASNSFRADNGYLHYTVLYGGGALASFQPAGLGADQEIVFGYDVSGTGETDGWNPYTQWYGVWWKDDSNFLQLTFDPSTNRISVVACVAGQNTTVGTFSPANFKTSGEVLVRLRAGKLRIRVDGHWLPASVLSAPFQELDVTTVPVANRSGGVGLATSTYRWAQWQYVRVKPLDISIDTPPEFMPRDSKAATGASAFPISGTFSGTASAWYARVLLAADLSVVQDWKTISPTINGSAWSATMPVPTGGPYVLEVGYTGADGLSHVAQSERTMVGALVAYYGQSNSVKRQGNPTTIRYETAGAASITGTPGAPAGAWATADAPWWGGTSCGALAADMSSALGVPVGVISGGVSGTGIGYLSPGGDGWQTFLDELTNARGKPEAVIWDQGEGDADAAFPPDGYAQAFHDTLLPGLRSATGNPTLPVFVVFTGRYALNQPPTAIPQAQGDAQRDELHQHQLKVLAGSGDQYSDAHTFIASSCLGRVHADGDGYHYTPDGYATGSRRDARSVLLHAYGVGTHDGAGPKVTGASRSGAAITLALDLNGAASLTEASVNTGTVPTQPTGALKGYQVSADNFATLLPINSVAISGTSLVITLASVPSGAVKVRSMYGWSFDDTDLFYGVYSDGTPNIPVFPIYTPEVAG